MPSPDDPTQVNADNPPDLDALTGTQGSPGKFERPEKDPFNSSKWQEGTRTFLAILLVVNILLTQFLALGFVLAPILIPVFTGKEKKDRDENKSVVKLGSDSYLYVLRNEDEEKNSRELITLIWTSQVTLIGGALGFYFASKGGSSDR